MSFPFLLNKASDEEEKLAEGIKLYAMSNTARTPTNPPGSDQNLGHLRAQFETKITRKKVISTVKVSDSSVIVNFMFYYIYSLLEHLKCSWTYKRKFLPHTLTRDIMSNILVRMPVPAEKWKYYPTDMKDMLFKDFLVSNHVFCFVTS